MILRISFILIGLSIVMCLYRFFRGPQRLDRILAFDAINACAVGLLVLVSWNVDVGFNIDLMLLISLLGFLTPTAYIDYIYNLRQSSNKIELEEGEIKND